MPDHAEPLTTATTRSLDAARRVRAWLDHTRDTSGAWPDHLGPDGPSTRDVATLAYAPDYDRLTVENDQLRQRVGALLAERANDDTAPDSPVRASRELLESLVDGEGCWFDHHGGCQAHGYLSLQPGETCPQAELKQLLAAQSTSTGDTETTDG